MSFLYQALIKEQKKEQQGNQASADNVQPEQPQAATFSSQVASGTGHSPAYQGQAFNMAATAPEQSNKNHWFWLVIAALLMIVGLLGGYLFGSKDSNQALYSSIQQQTSQVQQKQQELAQGLAELAETNKQVVESAQAVPAVPVVQTNPEPTAQIEVAVGQDGKVKTQVTNVPEQTGQFDAEQEQLVKRNILPEVAIEDIPDTLKSTFADAVKATEQEQEPGLFESDVSSGSSLPLLSELPLSDIYWVPDMSYEMHIYASEPSERWIRVNGKTLAEGEALIDDLVLLEIRQDQIIWQGNSRRFAQNALKDFVKQ